MEEVIEYISDNSLPALTWLNALDSNAYSIVGSTFTLKNVLEANSDLDFIQTNTSRHPTITSNGLYFNQNDFLTAKNYNSFNLNKGYSFILIFKSVSLSMLNGFSISKDGINFNRLFNFYIENDTETGVDFSLYQFLESKKLENVDDDIKVVIVSHDVLNGVLTFSINKKPFVSLPLLIRGDLIDYTYSLLLGNNQSYSSPLEGDLIHFLLFDEVVNSSDLLNLSNLLITTKPFEEPNLQDLGFYGNTDKNILTNTTLIIQTKVVQNRQSVSYSFNAYINPDILLALILSALWDTIEEETWNQMTTENWNSLE